jgi:hypothetical protein
LRQAELIRDQRFYAAPYAAAHGWVCMHADQSVDWKEVTELLHDSYRGVALKRMLEAMGDGRVKRPDPRKKGTRRRSGRTVA